MVDDEFLKGYNADLLKSMKRGLKLTVPDHDEELTEVLEDATAHIKSLITGEDTLYDDYLYSQRNFRTAILAHARWIFVTGHWSNLKINQNESSEVLSKAVNKLTKHLSLRVARKRRESMRGESDGS